MSPRDIYFLKPVIDKDLCESLLNTLSNSYSLHSDIINYLLTLYKYNVDTMSKFVYNGYSDMSNILKQYTREERKIMFSYYKSTNRDELLPLVEYKDELIECGINILQIADILHIPYTKCDYVPAEVWRYWLNTDRCVHNVIANCYMYSTLWIDISNNISRVNVPFRQLHNLMILVLLASKFDTDIYNAWSKYAVIFTDDMLDAGLIHWLADNKEKAFDYLCKSSKNSISALRNHYSDEFEALCKSFERG